MKTTLKQVCLISMFFTLPCNLILCQIKVDETGFVGIHSPATIKGYFHINAGDGSFATAPRIDIFSTGTIITSPSTALSLYNNSLTSNNWIRLQFSTTKSDGVEEDFGTVAVQFKNRTSGTQSGDLHLSTVNRGIYASRFSILSSPSANQVQFFFNTGSSSAGDGVSLYTYSSQPAFYPSTSLKGYLGTSTKLWNYIYANNIYYNTTCAKLSDLRIKTDISNIGISALNKILLLRGVKYRLKSELEDEPTLSNAKGSYYLGFIAQEVKDVIPEVVVYDNDRDLYSIDYTSLIPVLVEAVKIQQQRIEDLEKEIASIKTSKGR